MQEIHVNYLKSLLRMAELKVLRALVANLGAGFPPSGQLTDEAGRALLEFVRFG